MTDWRLGSYQLQRKLGEGGMAQVYLARDVRLDREVAVKVLDRKLADRPGFRERFMREAKLAAALDHPNIVPLYDFGDEDALYLVMPYLSGGSLQDLLPKAPLSTGEVVTFGSQIADALDYAHQRKVVHRDVKPANVLIHADGRLMLSDFGLAKIVSQANTPNAPRNHPDAGTPEYMAPEQVVGSSDARSDIYGLGVVLYLLLTGRLPFVGHSSRDVMEAHLRRVPKPPRHYNPAIPPAMEGVVLRAMAKRPEDRYQRASELGAALLGALISDQASQPFSFASDPLSGASRPGDPGMGFSDPMRAPGYPSDRPMTSGPVWRPAPQDVDEPGQFGIRPGAQATQPRGQGEPSVHNDRSDRAASSLTGILPDLDLPFTALSAPETPGSDGHHLQPPLAPYPTQYIGSDYAASGPTMGPTSSARFSGSSASSHRWNSASQAPLIPGSGPGTGRLSNSSGRHPAAPPISDAQRLHDTAPRVATRMAQIQQGYQTSAPWGERVPPPEPIDPRAALPGSYVTSPPEQFTPAERSPRLWIVIGVLLVVLAVAVFALMQFLQVGTPH